MWTKGLLLYYCSERKGEPRRPAGAKMARAVQGQAQGQAYSTKHGSTVTSSFTAPTNLPAHVHHRHDIEDAPSVKRIRRGRGICHPIEVPAIHSSHADSRVPGLAAPSRLHPNFPPSYRRLHPTPTTSLTRPSSRIPRPVPTPSPSRPRRYGNKFTSPSSQGWQQQLCFSLWFLARFLASNEDPVFRPTTVTSNPPPRSSQPLIPPWMQN
ncbi:hypothetical protein EDB86DRAFT_3106953 [Lactarius hatsudake]|nr:hypothetical protein EDB86DRAFT_3106953 [Lactarius hatsudake]